MNRPICWVCKEREAGTGVIRSNGSPVGWCAECTEKIFREAFEGEPEDHPDIQNNETSTSIERGIERMLTPGVEEAAKVVFIYFATITISLIVGISIGLIGGWIIWG